MQPLIRGSGFESSPAQILRHLISNSKMDVNTSGVKRPRMDDEDVDIPAPKQRRIIDIIPMIDPRADRLKAKARMTISTYKSRPPPRPFTQEIWGNPWAEARAWIAKEDEEKRQLALARILVTPDPWTPWPVRRIVDADHPEIVNRASRFTSPECRSASLGVNDSELVRSENQQPLLPDSVDFAATTETAEATRSPAALEKENAKMKAEVSKIRSVRQEARHAKADLDQSEKRVEALEEEVKKSYRQGMEQGKKDRVDEIDALAKEKEERDGTISTLQTESTVKDNEMTALKRAHEGK